MNTPSELYVGLISGTSVDGIDAALVDFGTPKPTLLAAATYPFPPSLHAELIALCQPGNDEIERMGQADRALGEALAAAVKALLGKAGIDASAVRAIGSHGQTIRHRPKLGASTQAAFTLQIGDPTTIVQRTGITAVADFRRRDIAAGGQGAPLVPAFHRAVFSGARNRVIVNIGGIANITALPQTGDVSGFDTGPGNTLLDAWISRHQGRAFDRDGAWAATGQVQPALLAELLADPYFALPAPKSTGREYFQLEWLDRQLGRHGTSLAAPDVQATLLELTATSIAQAIAALPFTANEVFVCGGGAHNRRLMLRLEALLHPRLLANTGDLGIAPDWVEAAAFAWLARETLAGRPGNAPAVTGAIQACVLGAIYPA